MPIKSYLAYSVTGRRDALAQVLTALGGCEVIPASNREVALGAFVFTVLAKAAIPVELGRTRWRRHAESGRGRKADR